jgi:hypothetical protein
MACEGRLAAWQRHGGTGIEGWQQAKRQIEYYYEYYAWERGASCIPPRLIGITDTQIVADTPEELTLNVRYLWDVEGQNDNEVIAACFGQGERIFVLARHHPGYSVVSMTGAQRTLD